MPLIIRSLNRGSQSDEAVIPPASFSYYQTDLITLNGCDLALGISLPEAGIQAGRLGLVAERGSRLAAEGGRLLTITLSEVF
jgi:hypothetical protein